MMKREQRKLLYLLSVTCASYLFTQTATRRIVRLLVSFASKAIKRCFCLAAVRLTREFKPWIKPSVVLERERERERERKYNRAFTSPPDEKACNCGQKRKISKKRRTYRRSHKSRQKFLRISLDSNFVHFFPIFPIFGPGNFLSSSSLKDFPNWLG